MSDNNNLSEPSVQPSNTQNTELPTTYPIETTNGNDIARYNYLRGIIFVFTNGLSETLNDWKDSVYHRLFHELLFTRRVEVANIAGLAELENANFAELCERLEECLRELDVLHDAVMEHMPCAEQDL